MPITCGNRAATHCMGVHDTVAQVRACYRGPTAAIEQASAQMHLDPPPPPLPEMKEGMWKIGDRIFKVLIAHHGSGRLYCKELVWQKVPDREQYEHWWEFRPGFLGTLRREGTQMTLEDAMKLGALYGVCCNCGRILTNETSIELGIGPICRGKFAA